MRVFLLLATLFLSSGAFAQNGSASTTYDARLLEVYEESHLDNLQTNNPFLIQYLSYFLDHGWAFETFPAEKVSGLDKVVVADITQINVLKLLADKKVSKGYLNRNYFQIEGSNDVLVILSEKEFTAKLNTFLGRTY